MSKSATREYIERMRGRYRAMKTKRAKGSVLDDFCATTELERKHAIKVLRSRKGPLRRSGRKAVYGRAVAQALEKIWLLAAQPCSKLMHPIMDCYVSSYEGQEGAFPAKVRRQLLGVSPSTMDRLLKPARVRSPQRRRSPQGVAAVKREVPIRAGEWGVAEPGWMEADTVAHCGGSMEGSFAWSLTLTDILTQWTEIRVMWNRGAAATFGRIEEIEKALPWVIQGFDSDNGPEFMNWNLYDYFHSKNPPVSFTRSRPYHKNDNAHVEQKNGTHVRGLLGHDRIEDPECVEGLNQAVTLWSLWKNLYSPVMKLTSKTREGHRYIKRYDKAQTPAQRALTCAKVAESKKQRIQALLAATDCFTLKYQVDESLREVFAAIRKRQVVAARATSPGAGTLALRATPSGPALAPGKVGNRPKGNRVWTGIRRSKDRERMVS